MDEADLKTRLNQIKQELEEIPDDTDLLNDAGVGYYLLGEYQKSLPYLKKAAEITSSTTCLFNLANVYSSLGKLQKSIDTYLQVLDKDPAHIGALTNLADDYERKGDMDRAHELFRYLTQLQPDEALSYFNLGNFLLRQNQHIEAAKCYEKAIKKDPGFADAYHNIAWILYRAGAFQKCKEYIEQGLKADSEHQDLRSLKNKLKNS